LLLNDDTIRGWFKLFEQRGIEGLISFDVGGSASFLSAAQEAALKVFVSATLPRSTRHNRLRRHGDDRPSFNKLRGVNPCGGRPRAPTASARAARGPAIDRAQYGRPGMQLRLTRWRGRNSGLENRPSALVPAPCSRGLGLRLRHTGGTGDAPGAPGRAAPSTGSAPDSQSAPADPAPAGLPRGRTSSAASSAAAGKLALTLPASNSNWRLE